uniref:uncharacterized protein LOC120341540 n=1 Tax=Styela clava TaxID=7725 RepID=UPI001939FF99|nr:uncharacterized protein LOC120341540 [Styela clava]XP_039266008.1 uncharacterized protein LOC120341540 [Styela clava]
MADKTAESSSEILDEPQEELIYLNESYSGEENEKEKIWLKERIPIVHHLAIAQILFAIMSMCISAFVLACKPCETYQSAGSGVWCPVFFLVLGAMCRGNKDDMHSYKIICTFGLVSAYFAILMIVIETIECVSAFQDSPQNLISATMHIILFVIAAVEFVLIVATICLHKRRKFSEEGKSYDLVKSSTDDCISTRLHALS